MKLTYSQLVQTPWGYSFSGNYRTYKARLSADNAKALVKVVGNANLIHLFTAKSGKVIITITDYSASAVWELIRLFKLTKPAKQLELKLK